MPSSTPSKISQIQWVPYCQVFSGDPSSISAQNDAEEKLKEIESARARALERVIGKLEKGFQETERDPIVVVNGVTVAASDSGILQKLVVDDL
jgi:hypothetical protein